MRTELTSCVLALLCATAALAQLPKSLVTYSPGSVEASPAAATARLVTLRTDLLETGAKSFVLDLPDGPVYTALLTGFELRGPGDAAWRGELEFDPGSRVVLTLKKGFVAGRVVAGTGLYEIRPLAGGKQSFEKLDSTLFPECGGGVDPRPGAASLPDVGAAADPVDQIKVMSLYTPQAEAAAGGQAQIETTIQAAVDNSNTSFIDSDMVARFILIHTEQSTHNDSGDLAVDLSWLASNSGVAARRDQQAADMVSLIVNAGGGFCGRGYVMRNPGAGFESSAFQVTARDCAVGNLSYAHEHGHNMGFEHDPANGTTPGNASYIWSFGHFVNGSYRTVMSYSSECTQGCTRVAHFSNPDVLHNSQPTGIANQRDNARSGDLTAPIVANFRIDSAVCGNGTIEAGEECDGADLGGASCGDAGCGGGSVSCTGSCVLDYSGCTGCPACGTFDSTDIPKPIPEGGGTSGTTTSTLTVGAAQGGTIVDLNVLDLAGTHTYIGDLDFFIESPATTSVQIREQACGSDEDFDISYDDEAAPGDPPCPPIDGGTYQPESPLAAFDGENSTGTWTLTVEDNFSGDFGELGGWSLEICLEEGCSQPTIELSNLTVADSQAYSACNSITVGPDVTVESTGELNLSAPITIINNDVSIGGSFSAG